jgi:hypothetical protein
MNGLEVGRPSGKKAPRASAHSVPARVRVTSSKPGAGLDRPIANGSPTSITKFEATIGQLKSLLLGPAYVETRDLELAFPHFPGNEAFQIFGIICPFPDI